MTGLLKHIDVLAIAFLLGGVALYSQARQSTLVIAQSARLIEFTNRQFLPAITKPILPNLCLTRD